MQCRCVDSVRCETYISMFEQDRAASGQADPRNHSLGVKAVQILKFGASPLKQARPLFMAGHHVEQCSFHLHDFTPCLPHIFQLS